MDTTIVLKGKEETPEQMQKASGWANFGSKAAKNEVAINFKAEQAIEQYTLPTDMLQLQTYDTKLAELKKLQAGLVLDRKKDTDITDSWKERRMQAEKLVAEHIAAYGAALLPLKQRAKAKADAEQAKAAALIAFRTSAQIEYNDLQARCAIVVSNKVAELFTLAIESDAVKEINASVMERMKGKLTEADFKLGEVVHADAEKQAIVTEIFAAHSPAAFVAMFHQQLLVKFADFANAKQNKAAALEQTKQEAEKQQAQVQEQQTIGNMAATMLADAAPSVELTHKALKESYEVDMPDTAASALQIMSAFIACNGWDKLRVKSVFNCKVSQMADVLGKLKSEDNSLTMTGITFKKVEKL